MDTLIDVINRWSDCITSSIVHVYCRNEVEAVKSLLPMALLFHPIHRHLLLRHPPGGARMVSTATAAADC